MSSSVDKSSSSQPLLTGQNVVYGGIAWAVLALLFFLWFSASVPGEEKRPEWYSVGTYIFEEVAFLGAAILCFRNWRSPQIVSGRNVWLGIGLGMLFYFLGTLLFGYWELGLKQDPEVSPGDLFYLATYVCLSWGMVLAVISRRLNLEIWQWAITVAIAIAGIALAAWLYISTPAESKEAVTNTSPAIEQVDAGAAKSSNATKATAVKKNSKLVTQPTANLSTSKSEPASSTKDLTPEWVLSVERGLEPLKAPISIVYVVGDIFLLVVATTLLLAFWGGRFSQSWRMIAAAAFSFYIADVWFKYATDHIPNYQSGFLLEVFWVFSGVLFAVGAALEYETSIRSSRRSGRKRA